MQSISESFLSHDLQIVDAFSWLELNRPEVHAKILAEFPEASDIIFTGSSIDWDEMGVDEDWAGWLTMAIEDTDLVFWAEGEPWAHGAGQ